VLTILDMPQPEPRLYVTSPLFSSGVVELPNSQAHYLTHVLRLSVHARISIFNGEAGEWLAEIIETTKNRCIIRCLKIRREQTKPQDLHYIFAPLKHARLDFVVQKAVELGASCIQPVVTAHTQAVRLNMERMHANAIEAAEQCCVLSIPEIKPPVKLDSLMKTWDASRSLIFCDERAELSSPLAALEKVNPGKLAVLLGPEGGFSESERQMLLSKPFVTPISLGPRIMRADTAAVAALAIVNAVLGDWR